MTTDHDTAGREPDPLQRSDGEPELRRVLVPMPAADIGDLLAKAGKAVELLKALSHEHRLIVLCMLAEGEKSVTELEDSLGVRQPALSQQLARLREDGLVSTRREGRNVYYSLGRQEVREIILALYRAFCRP